MTNVKMNWKMKNNVTRFVMLLLPVRMTKAFAIRKRRLGIHKPNKKEEKEKKLEGVSNVVGRKSTYRIRIKLLSSKKLIDLSTIIFITSNHQYKNASSYSIHICNNLCLSRRCFVDLSDQAANVFSERYSPESSRHARAAGVCPIPSLHIPRELGNQTSTRVQVPFPIL